MKETPKLKEAIIILKDVMISRKRIRHRLGKKPVIDLTSQGDEGQMLRRSTRNSTKKIQTCRCCMGYICPVELYDEWGLLESDGRDVCDCLDKGCVGCHYPCPKCQSLKCGSMCRLNRKWIYDRLQIEGTHDTISFPKVPDATIHLRVKVER